MSRVLPAADPRALAGFILPATASLAAMLALALALPGAAHAQAAQGLGAATGATSGAAGTRAAVTGAITTGPASGATSPTGPVNITNLPGTTGNATSGAASDSPPGVPASAAGAAGARYVESCQQAMERGVANLGCQGPLYASEIARLKEEALRTNNPSLLTLLGDAYQSNRSAVSDIGQAYRWYLLGAVRGDPRAMQRLSELYKNGRGMAQDNIKALGYARLTQRLAPPGSSSAQQAAEVIGTLGSEMAAEEVVLAERFAAELERGLRQPDGAPLPSPVDAAGLAAAGGASPGGASPAVASPAGAARPGASISSRLPGMGAVQPGASNPSPAAAPVRNLPGQESLPARPQ
ncbi:MAG: sel1 repeat family protein [Comamonadaceae bacterium]|nr:MAG: sel1 repeat family protein [Comamonadaceae bacterium]